VRYTATQLSSTDLRPLCESKFSISPISSLKLHPNQLQIAFQTNLTSGLFDLVSKNVVSKKIPPLISENNSYFSSNICFSPNGDFLASARGVPGFSIHQFDDNLNASSPRSLEFSLKNYVTSLTFNPSKENQYLVAGLCNNQVLVCSTL
jgi:WD40 repeat protein